MTMFLNERIVDIEEADLNNKNHQNAICFLVNSYLRDPMGGNLPLHDEQMQKKLIEGLKRCPTSLCLLAFINHDPVGLVVAFHGFSTFAVKPLINIHDIVVNPGFRGQGVGRSLMERVERIGKNSGCCKITLEVRCDNEKARRLYSHLGYRECNPVMNFWTKNISG